MRSCDGREFAAPAPLFPGTGGSRPVRVIRAIRVIRVILIEGARP
jgi:hypothetical protein